jgi:CheY-like chemotaxis protein
VVSLNDLVSSMTDLIRSTVGGGVDIQISLQPDIWAAHCDVNQLESALLNLCINARDAMPEGGRITIETLNADPADTSVPKGDYVLLAVTDTGIGMTPDVIARAFEPFFTTKPVGEGTGLGLSQLHGFITQSGGHVVITSTPGAGSTVTLYLPRHSGDQPVPEAIPAVARAARAGINEAVLVVEDEDIVRMLVVDVLDGLGYAALEARDAMAALPIVASDTRIDLLVTDVGLPGMSGCQLVERARELRPDLKVLFITGTADNPGLDADAPDRNTEVLAKPFVVEALASKISGMIARHT